MRRISAVATTAALLIAASLPAMASAAAPERVTDTQTELACETLGAEAGTVSLYVGVSETYGTYAQLAFWASPAVQYEDPPTWFSTDSSVDLSADGTSILASFALVEFVDPEEPVGSVEPSAVAPGGDPVGTATLAAALTAAGEPETFSSAGRDGNRRYSIEGVFQQLTADGTLELPGDIVFDDLSGCWASRTSIQLFATNPDAWVSRFDDRSLSCMWMDETSTVELHGVSFDTGAYSEVYVADASGFAWGFTDSAVLTTSEFSASVALEAYDESSDTWTAAGTANASAALTTGDRINDLYREGDSKVRVQGVSLVADGSLTIETAAGSRVLRMDDASCTAQDLTVQFIWTSPASGRGPALANDGPDGAVALEPGDALRVRTGGTALEAEAACTVFDPDYGDMEIPLGHTVWYTVAGTGGELTIDTAGSDFDTVLGVYTSDGTGLTQVACVDDVFSEEDATLQAAVTIATEAGVTYFVQAGGFADATGTLHLSVN